MACFRLVLLVLTLCASSLPAQIGWVNELPLEGQLIPRDDSGFGTIDVSGAVTEFGWKSITVELKRNGSDYFSKKKMIPYAYPFKKAPFTFQLALEAGFHIYELSFLLEDWTGARTTVATRSPLFCGDAFLIAGQSNAISRRFYVTDPHANAYRSDWIRSFGNASENANEVYNERSWGVAEGEVKDANYSIGAWPIRLASLISESESVPVAMINGAMGGTAIAEHLRSDGNAFDLRTIYGRLLWRANEAQLKNSIRTIFWFQGESDGGDPSLYADCFAQLIDAWRQDYPSLERVYMMQVREGCGVPDDSMIAEIQRQAAAQHSEVSIVSTTALRDYDGCHYHFEGYEKLAFRLFDLVSRDLYFDPTLGFEVDSPNIHSASYTSSAADEIELVFNPLGTELWASPGAELDFTLADGARVTSITATGNRLTLALDRPSTSTRLRYVRFDPSRLLLDGSWIINTNGVGALNFDIPLQ